MTEWLLLSLALTSAGLPVRAAGPAPAPGSEAPAAGPESEASDPDAELAQRLKDAEALYAEGLRNFKAGHLEEGRAQFRKAFDIVVSSLDEETLPASLHAEFAAMLDKVRDWAGPEEAKDEAAGLEVSEASLKTATGTAAEITVRAIKLEPENPLVKRFVEIYSKTRPKTVEEALARSGLYKEMILAALKEKGLPRELFYLVMAESEYKFDALSHSGAAGLWQFMPGTARKYGLEVSYWVDERYLPEKETPAAARYLADLYQWFGDWNLAIAAYNRGEGGLGRDMQYSRANDFTGLAGRNALPEQTHHYVPKFMACVLIGEHPETYGLHPKYQAPEPYDEVPLPRDLDLGIAAKAAGTSEAAIRRLNPQLRAWCTPKNKPGFILRVPKGTKDAFLAALDKVPDWNPGPTLARYKVQAGDSLGKIARKYRTTIHSLLETNKIKNPRLIQPGTVLLIRPGRPAPNHSAKRKK